MPSSSWHMAGGRASLEVMRTGELAPSLTSGAPHLGSTVELALVVGEQESCPSPLLAKALDGLARAVPERSPW